MHELLKPESPIRKEDLIKDQIDDFKNKISTFESSDSEKIEEALTLMIELHSNQKDRSEGTPYISHPLAVVNDLITQYNIVDTDLLISALMHDSIEDQSRLLAIKQLSRQHSKQEAEKICSNYPEDKIKQLALIELEELFGSKVKNIVEQLSNPQFDSENKEHKNEQYKKHIANIVQDENVCIIKFADFARNALNIDQLKRNNSKKHFKKRYGPVIIDVFLPLFQEMAPSHPLFNKKEAIIKRLTDYYKLNY